MTEGLKQEDPAGIGLLSEAFSTFNVASARLEKYYRDLEERVRGLREELDQKNKVLLGHLQEKEEIQNFLDSILQSLSTGVIVTDLNGKVTMFNPAAERMTGCPVISALGRDLQGILETIGLPDWIRPDEILSGQPVSIPEIPYSKRLQGIEYISFSAAPVRGAQDQILGIVLLLQDVTELKKLEEQAERHHRLTAMGEMAVKIAHEIRNPLGSIELFASILKKEVAGDSDKENLAGHIISGVRALAHVLSNLLIFTKSPRPVFRPANLLKLIQETLSFSDPLLKEHRIQLVMDKPTREVEIGCDGELVKQVFLNLILNAIQAMPQGGTLSISVRDISGNPLSSRSLLLYGGEDDSARRVPGRVGCTDRWVEVVFSDTGTGIPKEDLTKIFNPFFTTKEKGTGLGLAIVHNILQVHGGTVEVDSALGRGSTFTIHLPGGDDEV